MAAASGRIITPYIFLTPAAGRLSAIQAMSRLVKDGSWIFYQERATYQLNLGIWVCRHFLPATSFSLQAP